MFFYLSKVLWFLADPGNHIPIGLLLVTAALLLRWRRTFRTLLFLLVGYALVIGFLPVGKTMRAALEDRIPIPRSLPDRVDGIVVLGGVVDQFLSEARGQTAIGGAVERITVSARLAAQYPDARIVYSGGSGVPGRQELKEANYIKPIFAQLGVEPSRLIIEDQSRNTAENAILTKELVKPAAEETWIFGDIGVSHAAGAWRFPACRLAGYPLSRRLFDGTQSGVSSDQRLYERVYRLRGVTSGVDRIGRLSSHGSYRCIFPGCGDGETMIRQSFVNLSRLKGGCCTAGCQLGGVGVNEDLF